MAPSGSLRKISRLRSSKRDSDGCAPPPANKKRRVETVQICGFDIHQFNDKLELEYFSNLEEPLTVKIRPFRGFDEDDNESLNLLKDFFDSNINKFVNGLPSSDPDRKLNGTTSNEISGASDSKPSAPPAAASDVIMINSDSDSDDDVVIVGDPTAPVPRPQQNCVCPSCGKVRLIKQKPSNVPDKLPEVTVKSVDSLVASPDAVVLKPLPPDLSGQQVVSGPSPSAVEKEPPQDKQCPPVPTRLSQPGKVSRTATVVKNKDLPVLALNTESSAAHVEKEDVKLQSKSVRQVDAQIGNAPVIPVDGNGKKSLQKIKPRRSRRIHAIEALPVDVKANDYIAKLPPKNAKPSNGDLLKEQVVEPVLPSTVHKAVESKEFSASKGIDPVKSLDSAQISATLGNLPAPKPASTLAITSSPSEPSPAVKSVVNALIDFVCLQKRFPRSHQYQYDELRRTQPCSTVPCGEDRCRLGCVCSSLSKKSVRRVRCNKVECIFGCCCRSRGMPPAVNRHAKTLPVKLMSFSRRKQVLTILPDCDSDANLVTQKALKSYLPVQKVLNAPKRCSSGDQAPRSVDSKSLGFEKTPKATPNRYVPVQKVPTILRNSLKDPTPARTNTNGSGFLPAQNTLNQNPPLRTTNGFLPPKPPNIVRPARRGFGREKTPIPEFALICLKPGLGYVPLDQHSPRVIIHDPFSSGDRKCFLEVRQAIEWLNSNLAKVLQERTALSWVVAHKTILERKQLNRLTVESLKNRAL